MSSNGPVKVYGSATKFRSDLTKRIKAADVLLARLEAARDRWRATPPPPPGATGLAARVGRLTNSGGINDVDESTTRWLVANDRLVEKYLGSGADEFKFYRRRSTPFDLDKPAGLADACEGTIREGVDQLQRLLHRLPHAGPTTIGPVEDRFAELRQTSLVEESVLNAYLTRMSKMRTRPQISAAIGAAKELVEACNRATLHRLGVDYPLGDFSKLGKIVRNELLKREGAAPSTKSGEAIGVLLTGMGTVEQALATLRNELGTGHGMPELPEGLRPRHAQLAIDIADTHVRYLVATLADLKLL